MLQLMYATPVNISATGNRRICQLELDGVSHERTFDPSTSDQSLTDFYHETGKAFGTLIAKYDKAIGLKKEVHVSNGAFLYDEGWRMKRQEEVPQTEFVLLKTKMREQGCRVPMAPRE